MIYFALIKVETLLLRSAKRSDHFIAQAWPCCRAHAIVAYSRRALPNYALSAPSRSPRSRRARSAAMIRQSYPPYSGFAISISAEIVSFTVIFQHDSCHRRQPGARRRRPTAPPPFSFVSDADDALTRFRPARRQQRRLHSSPLDECFSARSRSRHDDFRATKRCSLPARSSYGIFIAAGRRSVFAEPTMAHGRQMAHQMQVSAFGQRRARHAVIGRRCRRYGIAPPLRTRGRASRPPIFEAARDCH